ncbi:MAG: hypothetical protein RIC35_01970 [Marinoscillum sp.]
MEQAYHILLIGYLIVPMIYITYCLLKDKKEKATFPKVNWYQTINTAIVYALSFNLIFFWQELWLFLGKHAIGLTAYLYHNNHGWEGQDERAALMQGSGALAILFFGTICFFYSRSNPGNSWRKKLVLWLGINGLTMGLPQIQTAGIARDTDVGQAFAYLGVGSITAFLLALMSTLLLIGVLWVFFGKKGISDFRPKRDFKRAVVEIILPLALGTVIIFPFRIFPWHQIVYPVMHFVIIAPWILFLQTVSKSNRVSSENRTLQIVPVCVLLGLLLVFHLVLSPGIVW